MTTAPPNTITPAEHDAATSAFTRREARTVPCLFCGGRTGNDRCGTCHGTGRAADDATIQAAANDALARLETVGAAVMAEGAKL